MPDEQQKKWKQLGGKGDIVPTHDLPDASDIVPAHDLPVASSFDRQDTSRDALLANTPGRRVSQAAQSFLPALTGVAGDVLNKIPYVGPLIAGGAGVAGQGYADIISALTGYPREPENNTENLKYLGKVFASNAAGSLLGHGVGGALEKAPMKMASKVIKPSTAGEMVAQEKNLLLTPAEQAAEDTQRNRGMQAIIDNSWFPKSGKAKANQARFDAGQAINALFKAGDSVDGTGLQKILPAQEYERMFTDALERHRLTGDMTEADINSAFDIFANSEGKSIPSKIAHDMKLEMQAGTPYGKYSASIEAAMNRAGAKELNKQLRGKYPEYAGLNKKYNSLNNAQKFLERADGRLSNNSNVVGQAARYGTGALLGGAVGYKEGGREGAEEGALLGALLTRGITPNVRLGTAYAINKGLPIARKLQATNAAQAGVSALIQALLTGGSPTGEPQQ